MNNENKRNYISPNYEGPTVAIAKRLEELVDQIIGDPNSLYASLEIKRFIDTLPYGKVSFETLSALIEKTMEADPKTAFILLDFATNQELYLQKHPEIN